MIKISNKYEKEFCILFCLCFFNITRVFGQDDYYAVQLAKAKAGDIMAMLSVADNYRYGSENERDYKKAVEWYEKAANKGHARAMLEMGYAYEDGNGVTQNYIKAMDWYKKAAKEKDPGQALFHIGLMYYRGHGTNIDVAEAEKYFQKAAKLGHKYAQDWLEKIKKDEQIKESILLSQKNTGSKHVVIDVDMKVPITKVINRNTFAVIIGNETYSDEATVPYAENDAKVFKEYCRQTLGVNDKHIRYIANAGYNDIRKAINWLKQGLEAYGGDGSAIFYYAGHGIPDEAQKTAYLLPVDGIGSDVESAYSLERLYQTLGEMPAKSITVFLDACFSGAKRDGGMMASARGVAIKTKAEEPKGKMVVFTAAQGDETAYPYKSQQHGMFTYYLLRKLQETKGDVTLGELADYITREVKRQSFDENSRSQTPTVNASASISSIWRNLKLK